MTAVLSATDALRRDRIMSSHDDNQINYSPGSASTDWKEKYYEAADMLAETRAELDDFQHSSKELEEELERELERTEKAQNELRMKVSKVEAERDEWKSKFMSLQTTHNTTTTSLQRELDTVRQSHQQLKVQMRELEMGNDDLERNERAVTSTLADMEGKYSRVLEEKILLEHELLDKASLEEQCQRLKDELTDAALEVTVLKERIAQAQSAPQLMESESSSTPSSLMPYGPLADEDILKMRPPSELLLSDLGRGSGESTSTSASGSSGDSTSPPTTVENTPVPLQRKNSTAGQTALLKRAGFPSFRANNSPSGSPSALPLSRSSTMPSFSPSRGPRTPTQTTRPPLAHRNMTEASLASSSSAMSTQPGTASRSKGVQMVSEMRARVRNLEQKLHTRVPRLRMGSITSRAAANSIPTTVFGFSTNTPENPRGSTRKMSTESENEKKKSAGNSGKQKVNGDTSGWVLIMEDGASPTPKKEKRRSSSPSGIPFHPAASTNTPTASAAGPSGMRRPQSRLSVSTDGRGSARSTTTTSSIPSPSSRPATPTFLPVPTSGLYGQGKPGLKRSTGPQPKRSSLGSSVSPNFLQPPHALEGMSRERPMSFQSSLMASTSHDLKALPPTPPNPNPNVTVRPGRGSGGATHNVLAQSRLSRPTSLGVGRKSLDTVSDDGGVEAAKRVRAGSTAALGGRLT
ncbi:hypothetical protein BD410DRAFT_834493 [Rickenella mellea]|uniref:NUDE domain-containing protein n=1 Tax=Rickenella mellea TaxID=50990 RepID=A0A4Y7QMV6_9AGAM|nr:hypothetical protein BD410DRAFT_834493 [Rickenella mellea]